MVARSRPSTRRPNLRGEPKSSESTPVTDEGVPPELPGALRSKRARLSSISDSQRLAKRLKSDQNNAISKFKFPLRNRRPEHKTCQRYKTCIVGLCRGQCCADFHHNSTKQTDKPTQHKQNTPKECY